jgi:hypothetical protein
MTGLGATAGVIGEAGQGCAAGHVAESGTTTSGAGGR